MAETTDDGGLESSGLSKGHENPGTFKRLKKSVSRMATRRRNKSTPREGAAVVATREAATAVANTSERDEGLQRRAAPAGNRPWEVDPAVRAFSDTLHEVLHVHSVIEKTRKSLKAAEKLTKTLKEQSLASLEISKQDFTLSGSTDAKGRTARIHTPFRKQPRYAGHQTSLDSMEHRIRHSTMDTIGATIEDMMRIRSDAVQAAARTHGKNVGQGCQSHLLAELDSLTTHICGLLLAKDESNKGEEVGQVETDKVARLLGQVASPRVQLQYMLNYYSRRMRLKLSSDIVSASVPDTFHFSLEEGGNRSPAQMSSNIGFTMTSMLLDAEQCVRHVVEPDVDPRLQRLFGHWVQKRVREACDVLLRLVILPMAAPMGLSVVSRCLSLFQSYCRAVQLALKVPIQNVVTSILYRPFMDLIERKVEQHTESSQGNTTSKEQSAMDECTSIMELLRSNKFVMGHRYWETQRWVATEVAKRYVDSIQPENDRDASALAARLLSAVEGRRQVPPP